MSETFELMKKLIRSIQEQQGYQKTEIQPQAHLVKNLGFTSLDIAQLIAMLEGETGFDPFSSGATIDQISTVESVANLYSAKAATNTRPGVANG